jgi:hypothetical protein
MEALRLNEKGNKGKEKTVEEKKKSGMKTALNAFKRGGRGRGARDRGGKGERGCRGRGGRDERGKGAGAGSTQTLNTTQSKLQSSPTTTQHNSTNSPQC